VGGAGGGGGLWLGRGWRRLWRVLVLRWRVGGGAGGEGGGGGTQSSSIKQQKQNNLIEKTNPIHKILDSVPLHPHKATDVDYTKNQASKTEATNPCQRKHKNKIFPTRHLATTNTSSQEAPRCVVLCGVVGAWGWPVGVGLRRLSFFYPPRIPPRAFHDLLFTLTELSTFVACSIAR